MALNSVSVESSFIKSIGHDASEDVIEVVFKNGKTLIYKGTEDDFHEFCSAPSCGQHYNENFKGKEL